MKTTSASSRGLVGPEAALDLGARLGIVVADLARDGVGVHGRRPEVAQHPGHGALSAADVAGQADHLHGPADPTGSGWQWGQKCVLRWATTMRRIGRPHR